MLNNFIKPGLQDLCVSRTTLKWGIPVDYDSKHVVYVWLDALTNYITNIGFDVDNENDEFKKLWPADLHLIGKDIIRFHTIYWPCFLWSLGLELPKKVFGHPWLLTSSDKMSKSKGNVIYADDLVDKFGLDAVRFYLLHEIPFASDGNITYDLLIERINGELANVLGNLVQRTISMGNKYFEGNISNKNVSGEVDAPFINSINTLDSLVTSKMDELQVADAITEIFNVLRASNKYIDDTMPWALAKDETQQDRLETVLYNLLESIRVCGSMLEAFMPDTSASILNQINSSDKTYAFNENNSYKLGQPSPLFQRIDRDKFIAEYNLEV
jgi:methionyl-tRNA synthetase